MRGIAETPVPQLKYLGLCDYAPVCRAMREFTLHRNERTADEFWILEHNPVYTLGQAGHREHLLNPGTIPVMQSDRGGQVTYHGPGQVVVYTLLDLRRLGLGVRHLVSNLEAGVIEMLEEFNLKGHRVDRAPGVYVAGAKLAALGLRIRSGCSYHGIALNVAMDLDPFNDINPCGYSDLQVTQLSHFGVHVAPADIAERLVAHLCRILELQPATELVTDGCPRLNPSTLGS